MTMDVQRQGDGHWSFALGPVEKWIVAAIAAGVVIAAYWFIGSVMSRLDNQSSAISALATQQAVTNSQLTTLNLQLADVPSITRKIAEHDVRLQRLEEDTRELRGTRNLK